MRAFRTKRTEPRTRGWKRCAPALLLALVLPGFAAAHASSCTTQAMMKPAQRQALFHASRNLIVDVQQGNLQALQAATIPAIANDFSAIRASAQTLHPLIAHATITVDNLYLLDAADIAPGTRETDFSCGLPGSLMSVGLSFHNLPPGHYAFAILHATGVPHPQQFALVLQKTKSGQWNLAGFFHRPMTMAGHDGIWFWTHARQYAQRKMKWNAWLYYQAARQLLRPVNFLTSPNLAMLDHEAAGVKPEFWPGSKPMRLLTSTGSFSITSMAATDALGPLDLSVQYQPDTAQAAQLNDPLAARKQVTSAMVSLLDGHPQLRVAFHGIWMQAEQGGSSAYALELPMNQIQPETSTPGTKPTSQAQ